MAPNTAMGDQWRLINDGELVRGDGTNQYQWGLYSMNGEFLLRNEYTFYSWP